MVLPKNLAALRGGTYFFDQFVDCRPPLRRRPAALSRAFIPANDQAGRRDRLRDRGTRRRGLNGASVAARRACFGTPDAWLLVARVPVRRTIDIQPSVAQRINLRLTFGFQPGLDGSSAWRRHSGFRAQSHRSDIGQRVGRGRSGRTPREGAHAQDSDKCNAQCPCVFSSLDPRACRLPVVITTQSRDIDSPPWENTHRVLQPPTG